MRKLSKNRQKLENSVEAYACGCACRCNCACASGRRVADIGNDASSSGRTTTLNRAR